MFASLLRHDGWNVGLVQAGARALLAGGTPDVAWLRLDAGRAFAADPFLVEDGERTYCFFELLPYASNCGRICYVELDARGAASPVRDAIVEPHHLSYPYVFRYGGEWLCVPEAWESGCVQAYVARAFPDGWTRAQVLLEDFAGVDNTLFEHDGRWWLLNGDGRASANTELYCWYARSPLGPWTPHAANPVKRGAAGTRCAGRPFTVDGVLYRPAQDCTERYGARLIVNQIVELTPERFTERAVSVVEPDPGGPYPHGLHTANTCGERTIVDGNRLHFVPEHVPRAIAARWRKLWNRTSARSAAAL